MRIEPGDAVGAGDAMVAATGRAGAGLAPGGAAGTAVRTGALACLARGDWKGLPRRAEQGTLVAREPVVRSASEVRTDCRSLLSAAKCCYECFDHHPRHTAGDRDELAARAAHSGRSTAGVSADAGLVR